MEPNTLPPWSKCCAEQAAHNEDRSVVRSECRSHRCRPNAQGTFPHTGAREARRRPSRMLGAGPTVAAGRVPVTLHLGGSRADAGVLLAAIPLGGALGALVLLRAVPVAHRRRVAAPRHRNTDPPPGRPIAIRSSAPAAQPTHHSG